MQRTDLTENWTLLHLGGPAPTGLANCEIEAQVPGVAHTALRAAGLTEELFMDDQEAAQSWVGQSRWRYRTEFTLTELTPGLDLLFEGIDTVATIHLNGQELGRSENMHRSYRYSLHGSAILGVNVLEVDLESPVKEADRRSLELGYRPHVNAHPFNSMRKMASSFGWDWGIDTSSVGIWRPVRLEQWSARLSHVRPIATVDETTGRLELHVSVARSNDEQQLALSVEIAGLVVHADVPRDTDEITVHIDVPDAKRWWPRGHGEPTLYPGKVVLTEKHPDRGTVTAAEHQFRIGFREVSLDTTPDEYGTPLTLVVNGRAIDVRGANWIPDDAFPHRVTRDRYGARIAQAEFAELNLLRVWGGGIFETSDFYELCDERGILVMQDFLFACAAYAEEEPLRTEIELEAREAVSRLAQHASLVILNGNNENLWGMHEWGYVSRLDDASWGSHYYYELLPAIVAELAPHITYTPGSPFTPSHSGLGDDPDHNDPSHGSMHIWDVWNEKDYTAYRQYTPRFVAEYGWQAPPTWTTLSRFITDDPLTPESPGMVVHQKAIEGNHKLTDGLLPHLRLPNTMSDWHWAMQLNQAAAIRTAIGWFRSRSPICSGSIIWQLNDSWPATSWSAVDSSGLAKPMLYALRHMNQPRLVTIQPSPDGLEVAILNDSDELWADELSIERCSYDGRTKSRSSLTVSVAPRSSQRVLVPAEVGVAGSPAQEFMAAHLGNVRDLWFFTEYRDSALSTPRFRSHLERAPEGYVLRIAAETLIRDLTLLIDKLDPNGFVGDALLTLLPGEEGLFQICSDRDMSLEELVDADVLRSANQLVVNAGAGSIKHQKFGPIPGGRPWKNSPTPPLSAHPSRAATHSWALQPEPQR